MSESRPPTAAFSAQERYRPPRTTEAVRVVVEGTACEGVLLALNGPRAHVRFERDGARYVRWFDVDDLLTA